VARGTPRPVTAETFDCQRCGACCRNPDENRAEGVFDWVEVAELFTISWFIQAPKHLAEQVDLPAAPGHG